MVLSAYFFEEMGQRRDLSPVGSTPQMARQKPGTSNSKAGYQKVEWEVNVVETRTSPPVGCLPLRWRLNPQATVPAPKSTLC